MPRTLYPLCNQWLGGWVGAETGPDNVKNVERSPSPHRPTSSQSLNWLRSHGFSLFWKHMKCIYVCVSSLVKQNCRALRNAAWLLLRLFSPSVRLYASNNSSANAARILMRFHTGKWIQSISSCNLTLCTKTCMQFRAWLAEWLQERKMSRTKKLYRDLKPRFTPATDFSLSLEAFEATKLT
jgi:hypothetical protein